MEIQHQVTTVLLFSFLLKLPCGSIVQLMFHGYSSVTIYPLSVHLEVAALLEEFLVLFSTPNQLPVCYLLGLVIIQFN